GDAQALSNSGGIIETDPATKLTLFDSAVTLNAGTDKSIEVFSGTVSARGNTSLRAAPSTGDISKNPNIVKVKIKDNGNSNSGLIVVGGRLSGTPPTPTTTSSNTSVGAGTYLLPNGGTTHILGNTVTNESTPEPGSYYELAGVTLKISGIFQQTENIARDKPWYTANASDSINLHDATINAKTGGQSLIQFFAPKISIIGSTITSDGSNGSIIIAGEKSAENNKAKIIYIEGGTLSTLCSPTSCNTGERAGNIVLKADNITIAENSIGGNPSLITAETQGDGVGGSITVQADHLGLQQGAKLSSQTSGSGTGGTINIDASSLTLSGGSQLTTNASNTGNAGKIYLNSPDPSQPQSPGNIFIPRDLSISFSQPVLSKEQPRINASTTFDKPSGGKGGVGGSITIGTAGKSLSISGPGFITAETKGTGDGGDVSLLGSTIKIQNHIEVSAKTTSSGQGGLVAVKANTLNLDDAARITAEASGKGNGGLISLHANSISLSKGAQATAETSSSGTGGTINVNAPTLTLNNGAQLTIKASSKGNAGDININTDPNNSRPTSIMFGYAKDSEKPLINARTEQQIAGGGQGGTIFIGTTTSHLSIAGPGKITAETQGSGNGGFLDLKGTAITLDHGAIATAETSGSGKGGNISVNTPALALNNGAELSVKASSTGNAGDININTDPNNSQSTSITFGYSTPLTNDSNKSLINAKTVLAAGGGQGGDILIGTPLATLTIAGPGLITAQTEGSGDAGSIDLQARTLTLDQGTRVSAISEGSGRGGAIRVQGNTVVLDGGAEISTSSGMSSGSGPTGPAGSITIDAAGPNSLHLSGGSRITSTTSSSLPFTTAADQANILIKTPNLSMRDGSWISAATTGAARGGTITINANQASLTAGSKITAKGEGGGQAGNINIQLARGLSLIDRSEINASTTASDGGKSGANINLQLGADLNMSNGSKITAAAKGKANGGNVTIDMPNAFLFSSFPSLFEGNDILATADEGDGGLIQMRALGIFGVNLYTYGQPISEASARSRRGRNGVLAFFIPYLTPELQPAPIEQPLDPDNVLVRACAPRADGPPSFILSGRGGLPELPGGRSVATPIPEDLGQSAAPASSARPHAAAPTPSPASGVAGPPPAGALTSQLPLPPCP
ncbi:MAG: hypothetical protein WAM11_07840, partial [Cyanobium sp.]